MAINIETLLGKMPKMGVPCFDQVVELSTQKADTFLGLLNGDTSGKTDIFKKITQADDEMSKIDAKIAQTCPIQDPLLRYPLIRGLSCSFRNDGTGGKISG